MPHVGNGGFSKYAMHFFNLTMFFFVFTGTVARLARNYRDMVILSGVLNIGCFFILQYFHEKKTPFLVELTGVNCSCAKSGKEKLEKTRQMELQLPELSYVVVPSFLLFHV